MRTVIVDGIKCEVHSCQDCPCCEVDDYGRPSECKHPLNSEVHIYPPDEDGQQEIIRHGGKASVDRCPLKETVNKEVQG